MHSKFLWANYYDKTGARNNITFMPKINRKNKARKVGIADKKSQKSRFIGSLMGLIEIACHSTVGLSLIATLLMVGVWLSIKYSNPWIFEKCIDAIKFNYQHVDEAKASYKLLVGKTLEDFIYFDSPILQNISKFVIRSYYFFFASMIIALANMYSKIIRPLFSK